MNAVTQAAEEVIRMIEDRRARAAGKRRNAEELIRQAIRDDEVANALSAILQASGVGEEPTVHFDDPRVNA